MVEYTFQVLEVIYRRLVDSVRFDTPIFPEDVFD